MSLHVSSAGGRGAKRRLRASVENYSSLAAQSFALQTAFVSALRRDAGSALAELVGCTHVGAFTAVEPVVAFVDATAVAEVLAAQARARAGAARRIKGAEVEAPAAVMHVGLFVDAVCAAQALTGWAFACSIVACR